MPEFTASPIVSAGADPGVYDASQKNSLSALGAQQDLTDRQTFRDNAAGLIARDPTATGLAMGANPTATQNLLSSVPATDQNARVQAADNLSVSGSLASATLNAPASQRAAVWSMGRDALTNAGYKNLPQGPYPGDDALILTQTASLPVTEQLKYKPQPFSANPQPLLSSVPGGGSVGPGGVQQGGASTSMPPAVSSPSSPGGVANYNAALAGSEAGSPTAVNSAGYAGQYQFGTGRLTDLGFYQPASGENPNANKWQGTFSIPGFPQVKTLADFRNNVSAQSAVQNASVANIDGAIAQTPGAQNFDRDGLRAVAHLGGIGGMQKFVASGGRFNPADSNGTSLTNYYQRFSGASGQPATPPAGQPVRVADNSQTTGIPPTATDASPGAAPPAAGAPSARLPLARADEQFPPSGAAPANAAPALPATPAGGAPAPTSSAASGITHPLAPGSPPQARSGLSALMPPQAVGARPGGYGANSDPAMTPPLAPVNALAGLGTSGVTPSGPAPSMTGGPGNPGTVAPQMTPLAAMQQAKVELGSSLNGMSPEAANAAQQARAQQILARQSAGASPAAASPAAVPPPAAPTLSLSSLGSTGVPAPAMRNALSGAVPSAPPQPNALSPLGQPAPQPQPGTPGAPAMAQPAAPSAPVYQFARDRMTMGYIPVPDQPGYAWALGPNNQPIAQRIPGAPGKGVNTKIEGGTAISTDVQDGHLVSSIPNVAPDTSRSTIVAGPNGNMVIQSGQVRGTIPFSTQPAQVEAWKADQSRATQVAQQATDAEQAVQIALEGRNIAQGLPTGAGGESRADISNWLKTYAPNSVYSAFVQSGALPDAPQSQEAAKIFLRQAATDEKQMGGSGGLGLTEKYAKANPSLNMQPEAIQAMSNLKAVTAQAAKDYSDKYLASFNQNQDVFLNQHGQYQPASNFDQQWHSQRNAQAYLGAVNAMNGKPYAEWSKGLQPQDQDYALGVISRLDPTAIVNGPNGRIGVVKGGGAQQGGSPSPGGSSAPAVGTVMQGFMFKGGNPADPGSWARAQ